MLWDRIIDGEACVYRMIGVGAGGVECGDPGVVAVDLDPIRSGVVFDIQSVVEWYPYPRYAELNGTPRPGYRDRTQRRYPFPAMWCEFTDGAGRCGVLVESDDNGALFSLYVSGRSLAWLAYSFRCNTDGSWWSERGQAGVRLHGKPGAGGMEAMDGVVVDEHLLRRAHPGYSPTEGIPFSHTEACYHEMVWLSQHWTFVHYAMLAADFTTIQGGPPIVTVTPPVSRKRIRSGRRPLASYRVIDIKPVPATDPRYAGMTQEERARHIVRGHFAEYGMNGKGKLFGKVAGKFWVPAHYRGNPELGEVDKSYRIHDDAILTSKRTA
jgi:hypothetical protein